MDFTELDLHPEGSEAYLIGALGYDATVMEQWLTKVDGDEFYSPHRGVVWAAARSLVEDGQVVEPVGLMHRLMKLDSWTAATEQVVKREMVAFRGSGDAGRHVEVVKDQALRRRLVRLALRAQQVAVTGGENAAEASAAVRALFDDLREDATADGGPQSWRQLYVRLMSTLEGDERPTVIPTGWGEFDDRISGGLHGGRMYVFGGRPGDGKSNVAFNIAAHVAEQGFRCLVVSAEMSDLEVTGRLAARGAEVPLSAINSYAVSATDKGRLRAYADGVGDMPLWVDARSRTLAAVKTTARRWKRRSGLDVLCVDYLQLLKTDLRGAIREQEVAHISRELVRLGQELDVPVVVPCQLNRAGSRRGVNARPIMEDLRESGQIEQDASVVVLLHHPVNEDTNLPTGEVTFILAKNRHGQTLDVSLDWNGGYAKISDFRRPAS